MTSDHLTTREAAQYLTLSVSWLEKARRRGDGPPFHRIPGTGRVVYHRLELDAWMLPTTTTTTTTTTDDKDSQ